MAVGIAIERADHTAVLLRAVASRCRDGAQVRRLLAPALAMVLAMVLDGRSRTEAARQNGMDRQTLRDWVHRYNQAGIEGLRSRHSPGAPTALTPAQMAELKALVIAGPDPATHQVVRWRCLDLRAEVPHRFDVTVHESTIGTDATPAQFQNYRKRSRNFVARRPCSRSERRIRNFVRVANHRRTDRVLPTPDRETG